MRTWGFEGLIIGGKLMGRRNLMNWWLSMRSRSEINAFGVINEMTALALQYEFLYYSVLIFCSNVQGDHQVPKIWIRTIW